MEILKIITADTSHIPLIRELTMQVWPQTYIPIIGEGQVSYMLEQFYSPEALEKQIDELRHRFIIGYLGDTPVAFASSSEVAPGVFKLHKLYILPGMQGKGIGRAMADNIAANARSMGAISLRLNVNIHNHAAKSFYERYGFRHLRDEDINIGSGYFMNDHVLQIALG